MTPRAVRFMGLLNGDVGGEADLARRATLLVDSGITSLQLRIKEKGGGDLLKAARTLSELCAPRRLPLIINDRPDVALLSSAHGVHLGARDLPVGTVRAIIPGDMWLGASARNPEDARKAEAAGANYIGCGAVHSTAGKPEAQVIGVAGVAAVAAAVRIPVVAIGGILPEDIPELLQAGAAGIAVMGPAMAQDPAAALSPYLAALGN